MVLLRGYNVFSPLAARSYLNNIESAFSDQRDVRVVVDVQRNEPVRRHNVRAELDAALFPHRADTLVLLVALDYSGHSESGAATAARIWLQALVACAYVTIDAAASWSATVFICWYIVVASAGSPPSA